MIYDWVDVGSLPGAHVTALSWVQEAFSFTVKRCV